MNHIFSSCILENTLIHNYNYAMENKIINHQKRNKIIFVASNNIFNIQAYHLLKDKILPLLEDEIIIHIYGSIKKYYIKS